jgi:DNA excision repair protein ERCC-6
MNYILFYFRPLSLNEIVNLLEETDDTDVEGDIFILPPVNANDELTDEDSGDEDTVDISNLPASMLRTEAELHLPEVEQCQEKEFFEPLQKINKEYHWSKKDYSSKEVAWKPTLQVSQDMSPIECFSLFFTEEVYELLTTETNKYLVRKNLAGDIKVCEIKCAIGILLVSGYCQVSRRRMYWENSPDSRNELIANALSRDRFSVIFSNLHCADNLNLDKSDKFAKVRPLMNIISSKFLENSPFKENHSVDEAMVPYYGKHGCKQFIRDKPIRYGYKLWVGTTSSGYIVWFEPYQGASTILNEKYSALGLGASVVLTYTDKLIGLGMGNNYHLFIDNFFTGLPLVTELTKRNIRVTGTIRENRTGKCPLPTNKEMKKKERGAVDYRVSDEIIICKWHDNNIVLVCSNACGVTPFQKTERYSKQLKKKISVLQPQLIHKYNRYMGGVDRSDQNISLYRTGIRGKKWYTPLMLHCIDMAVQNAWLLSRENGGALDLLSFRRRIALALVETNRIRQKPGPSRMSSLLIDLRYDGKDHLIVDQGKRTRCGYCHKQCPTRCIKCNIGVHVKCFVQYHTKDN